MTERIKKYPSSLSTEILTRGLGEDGMKKLYETYQEHCKHRHQIEPNPKDFKLANLVIKHGAKRAGEMVGVAAHFADYTLSKVSRWEYRRKN